ncbi:MAG: hypothetical protein C0423_01840 [Methylibium sp.]|nr:hypothetical protein [Methylibium sp.]
MPDTETQKPSSKVMAQLLGEPVPLDWRDRLDQAQSWRDRGQMLLAQARAAQLENDRQRAADLVQEAAAHEMAGTLRCLSDRQLEAFGREAWSEMAAQTEDERLQGSIESLMQLVRELVRRILLILSLGQLDIGSTMGHAHVQADVVDLAVKDAIQAELQTRAAEREAERAAQAEVLQIRDHRAPEAVDPGQVDHVETFLAGEPQRWADWLPVTRVALKVTEDYVTAWEANPSMGFDETAQIIFDAAERHGLELDEERRAELVRLHLERERAAEEAELQERVWERP